MTEKPSIVVFMSGPPFDTNRLKITDTKFVFPDGREIPVHMYELIRIKYFERLLSNDGYESQHVPENHKYYYIYRVNNGVAHDSMIYLLDAIYKHTCRIKWSDFMINDNYNIYMDKAIEIRDNSELYEIKINMD